MRAWLGLVLVLAGCGAETVELPDSASDSGTRPDLGTDDAAAPDAGAQDAGVIDIGQGLDAGLDPWAPVRPAIDEAALTDFTVQVGTADGVLFTYDKGQSTPTTSHQIASASKWLASAVFMSMVEEGLLSLDDHPQDYLDFWTADPNDPRSRVTLEDLLSFTSGLPRDIACPALTTEACAERIYDMAAGMSAEPGTIFEYGGSHMMVAGAMAVVASGGTHFGALFRRYVGDVLEMSPDAGFRPNPNIAGGGVMNLEDYAKFVRAIFARELVATSLPEMESDHTPSGIIDINYSPISPSGLEWHYGLGHWRECYSSTWVAECDTHVRLSSPGAFGFYPLIDRSAAVPYWLILSRQSNEGRAAVDSVELVARLTPLVEAAIGIE